METNEQFAHINGWGVDADPRNEPTYPLKKYTGDDHQRLGWQRPELQQAEIEILHSNERPGLSAVFGTSVPPAGLSGVIRRLAFTFSESSYGHWLPLLLADRVGVLEGLIDDLRNGHMPDFAAEKGLAAEIKFAKKPLVTPAAGTAFVLAALVGYRAIRRRKI